MPPDPLPPPPPPSLALHHTDKGDHCSQGFLPHPCHCKLKWFFFQSPYCFDFLRCSLGLNALTRCAAGAVLKYFLRKMHWLTPSMDSLLYLRVDHSFQPFPFTYSYRIFVPSFSYCHKFCLPPHTAFFLMAAFIFLLGMSRYRLRLKSAPMPLMSWIPWVSNSLHRNGRNISDSLGQKLNSSS